MFSRLLRISQSLKRLTKRSTFTQFDNTKNNKYNSPYSVSQQNEQAEDYDVCPTGIRKAAAKCLLYSLDMMPVFKGVVLVLSRVGYTWWKLQTPEDRQWYKEKLWEKRKAVWCTVAVVTGVLAGVLWYNIETDSGTGRSRLYLLNDAMLNRLADQVVAQYLEDFKGPTLLGSSDPAYRRVADVINRLLVANGIQDRNWNLAVVDQPNMLNAFVLPNRFIFVYTGIISILNDDQLAILVGHEMAHCLRRHINCADSFNFVVDVLCTIPVAYACATMDLPEAIAAHTLTYLAVNVFLTLPFSRSLEYEADERGLVLAANACVDVIEGYDMWMKIIESDSDQDRLDDSFWWLNTHPSKVDRMHRLLAMTQELLKLKNSRKSIVKAPRERRY